MYFRALTRGNVSADPGHVTAPPATPKIPSTCPKCGVAKNGKLSCCFRGGAWFRKCGDVGDSKFDHTWFDGTEACKSGIMFNLIDR